MTNEHVIVLKQLLIVFAFLAALLLGVVYLYRQSVKEMLKSFKYGHLVIAALVALGIMNDTDNNNGDAT